MRPIALKLFIVIFFALIVTGCQTGKLGIVEHEFNFSGSKSTINFVQISDLHFKPGDELNTKLVQSVREIRPDVILFTGDMIDDRKNMDAFSDYIGAFPKSSHMYAILGNWEYWSNIDIATLDRIYSANGITLLVNEDAVINIDGAPIRVVGLDDLLGGKPSLLAINWSDNQILIVLAHCPKLYDSIREVIPLKTKVMVLSGHTHGGQITFFGLPFRLPPGSGEYVAGLYHEDTFPLIVSRGIGTSVIDLRFFAQPDIIRILIR
ncbi:MAG: metallophosphoesterase [Nitrospirae bacterium]|nr:metallophosphoesterase [Nitrospirota bacterium]